MYAPVRDNGDEGPPGVPGAMGGGGGGGAAVNGQPGPGMPGFDNEEYMKAMGGVLQNPQFMQMAEKLGKEIMTVRCSPQLAVACRQAAGLTGDRTGVISVCSRSLLLWKGWLSTPSQADVTTTHLLGPA